MNNTYIIFTTMRIKKEYLETSCPAKVVSIFRIGDKLYAVTHYGELLVQQGKGEPFTHKCDLIVDDGQCLAHISNTFI